MRVGNEVDMQISNDGVRSDLGRLLSTGVLVGLLAGCFGGGDPPIVVVPAEPRSLPVAEADRLYADNTAAVDSMRQVITNSRDFARFWDMATSAQDPPPPLPSSIDFASHMVLLVTNGRKRSGDQIRVDSIGFRQVRNGDEGLRDVMYVVVRFTEDCSPFPGESYPLEIVRVQRADPAIEWVDLTPDCR